MYKNSLSVNIMSSSKNTGCFSETDVTPVTKAQNTRKRCKKKKDSKKKSVSIDCQDNISVDVSTEPNPDVFNNLVINSNTNFMGNPDNAASLLNLRSNSNVYTVNDSLFVDRAKSPLIMHPDEEFKDYTVYKIMKGAFNEEEYDSSEEGVSEDLDIEDVSVLTGHIINSNVYLTHDQWHTVRLIDGNTYACAVCGTLCSVGELVDHLNSTLHIAKLDAHKPRKKFDLSITRKINNIYHCAVCNEVFPIDKYSEHENSKNHEGNLLFSINKVSDLNSDEVSLQETKRTQILARNNIREPNNAPSNSKFNNTHENSLHSNHRPDRNVLRNTQPETYVHSYGNTEPGRNIQPNSNIQPNGNIQPNNIEMRGSFKISSSTYKDIKVYEEEMEDCVEEFTLPVEGVSYASIASKPRLEVPKILKIDLGTKEVRVKFESWHMITLTDVNRYYCMLCKDHFIRRLKVQHCQEPLHVACLSRCAVVGAFEDYLIREVNDKLYHCGHCNNLQYKSDIQIHIELHHPKKNKPLKSSEFNVSTNLTDVSTNHTNVSTNQIQEMEDLAPLQELDMFGDFTFGPFGTDIRISNLACHMLMLVDNSYFCALCCVFCEGDLLNHVYQATHKQLMSMTPFIRPFKNNLTRAIRDSLHCGICNILIAVDKIFDHNIDPSHTKALATALGMKKNERPIQEEKYQYVELNNQLLELPKLMLPSAHKFEVHTPDGNTFVLSSVTSGTLSPNNPQTKLTSNLKAKESNLKGDPTGHQPEAMTGKAGKSKQISESGHSINKKAKSGDSAHSNDPFVNIKEAKEHCKMIAKTENGELLDVTKEIDKKCGKDISEAKEHCKMIAKTEKDNAELDVTKEIDKKCGKDISITDIDFPESDEEMPEFKLDEVVFLKLKSTYFKVTNTAYNSLVHVANGTRYCFVCSITLDYSVLQRHVDSREHAKNMSKNKFLSNNLFSGQLFRQMYVMYQCAICNVLVSRTEIKTHLDWPIHIEKYDDSSQKLNKKLKDLLKSGAKEYTLETQKDYVYLNISDPTINLVTYIKSTDAEDNFVGNKILKKCRMIILGGNVMKVCFESWNGIHGSKSGVKCIICQFEFNEDELTEHLQTEYHNVALGIHFEKQFYPALIRKINENTVNCVICNIELPSKEFLVQEHIKGRKHEKYYNDILRTSNTDSYTDCYEDPLIL